MLLVEMSKAAESSDTTAAQLKTTLHQSKYVLLRRNPRAAIKLEALESCTLFRANAFIKKEERYLRIPKLG